MDPLVPNQVRYRAALHSEDDIVTVGAIFVNVSDELFIFPADRQKNLPIRQ